MTKLVWDQDGTRLYETGVSNGVLYLQNNGQYNIGYAWNGLTGVTESPSGAEPTPWYADNIKYLNVLSREDFAATIEAMTYPDAFAECDGTVQPTPGVSVSQQRRRRFGLSYRTRVGNDELDIDYGYKLHLVYGALAAPSEKAYATINDSPEAISFSWSVSTTEVNVTGLRPTALVTVDSTKVPAAKMTLLQDALYGTAGLDPRLPFPDEVISLIGSTLTVTVDPVAPTYNTTTKVITIPVVTGINYQIDGKTVTGSVTITKDTVVVAVAAAGYVLPAVTDDRFLFKF